VCYRLIDPGSEWRLHRQWFEQSAMGDLIGADYDRQRKRAAPKRGPSLGQSLCGLLQVLGWRCVGLRLQPMQIIGGPCVWLAAVKIARLSSFRTFSHDAI